ncbi:hypothetical protein ACM55H_04755 [Flavobacterium sp. ZT3R17]|uniref:hypothetical protein n=1 Tax=Flavobacterium cryoconiti TaxID=3398736 RepID=UPI003A8AED2F
MKLVILRKENWVADYVITMFSIINDSISKKKLDESNMTFVDKDESEIYYFEEDLNAFKFKIMIDFFQKSQSYEWILSEEESKLFLKCSHAAYYFETEKYKGKEESPRKKFLENHEKNFKY